MDETRQEIVPMNRKSDVDELRDTLLRINDDARRVSLEYVVLTGVNDSWKEACALADFARVTAGTSTYCRFIPSQAPPTSRLRRRQCVASPRTSALAFGVRSRSAEAAASILPARAANSPSKPNGPSEALLRSPPVHQTRQRRSRTPISVTSQPTTLAPNPASGT